MRVPNDVAARPQSGLSAADMVWELIAEGGINRYMVVFHSREADQVGPVRSARLSDLHYLPMLRGIFAHTAAQPIVLQRIRTAAAAGAFVDVDQFLYGAYYQRVSWRSAPQNVYTSTQRLREAAVAAGDGRQVDVPALAFPSGAPAAKGAATSFTIPYSGAMQVTYSYDQGAGGYRRAQAGVTTTDAETRQPVLATNVVVVSTDIRQVPGIIEDSLGALSLEIRSTGSGPVSVFNGGKRFDGTWSRQGNEMYAFTSEGAPIPLRPGQTWVHVIPADWTVTSAP